MSAVLDTHTVLWYLENSRELSVVARTTIEDAVRDARDVHVSAISLVETVYLVERRKLPVTALERLRSALTDPNSGFFIAPVDAGVADALSKVPRHVVPDMPDRIIAATALQLQLPLVTRDRRLQAAGIQTIW
jgi:PIN domain nuclease of toxin-antitoxin system